ncbi:hypothetical protein AB0M34_25255 [Nocardia sp. NPDC050193]
MHLLRRADVAEATVFRAALRPPGEGTPLLRRRGIRPARFDVVVLVRAESVPAAEGLRAEPVWREPARLFDGTARHTRVIAAGNPARIADVNHNADSWFLLNYFHCDDRQTVFDVWQYTAGRFQRETSLSDSALMQPLPGCRLRRQRDRRPADHLPPDVLTGPVGIRSRLVGVRGARGLALGAGQRQPHREPGVAGP